MSSIYLFKYIYWQETWDFLLRCSKAEGKPYEFTQLADELEQGERGNYRKTLNWELIRIMGITRKKKGKEDRNLSISE